MSQLKMEKVMIERENRHEDKETQRIMKWECFEEPYEEKTKFQISEDLIWYLSSYWISFKFTKLLKNY